MLPPRSVPAHPPVLDRDVLRAIAIPGGPQARTPEGLASEVIALVGRSEGAWIPDGPAALAAALRARVDGRIAAPCFGRADLGPALARGGDVVWMDPAEGRLDPGAEQVSAALSAGAKAVVVSPIAGHGDDLRAIEQACRDAGAVLAVDARWSPGCRLGDRTIAQHGDLVLLAPDGEPGPGAVWGAVLAGEGAAAIGTSEAPTTNGAARGHALSMLVTSLRDEPRVRRFLPAPAPRDRGPVERGRPPGWACAAASVRLAQSTHRATQRALHARTLRSHCGNVVGVEVVGDGPGGQAAGGGFALLVEHRDAVAEALQRGGVAVLDQGLGGLRPDGKLGWGARLLAQRLLLLPLLPFYRREDIVFIGEQLRLAAYAARS